MSDAGTSDAGRDEKTSDSQSVMLKENTESKAHKQPNSECKVQHSESKDHSERHSAKRDAKSNKTDEENERQRMRRQHLERHIGRYQSDDK